MEDMAFSIGNIVTVESDAGTTPRGFTDVRI
jgi:hypothetical protein